MSNITYVVGSAVEPIGDGKKIIAHICNNVGGWGAGFVVAVSNKWKEPEQYYRALFAQNDKNIVGVALGDNQIIQVERETYVCNMIAQEGYASKRNKIPLRYDSLRQCLSELAEVSIELGATVHMPRIGCGLAGGKWEQVEQIINETLCAKDVNVVVYDFQDKNSNSYIENSLSKD